MGNGFSIKCKKCNMYHLRIMLGVGFFDAPYHFDLPPSENPDGWRKINDSKVLKDVEYLMKNKKAKFKYEQDQPLFHGWKVYYSASDKSVFNLFYFELEYYENDIKVKYVPDYKDKNGNDLIQVEGGDYSIYDYEILCPVCGSEIEDNLDDKIEFFYWD